MIKPPIRQKRSLSIWTPKTTAVSEKVIKNLSLTYFSNTLLWMSIYFLRWADERLVGLCFEQFESKISSRSNIRESPFVDFVYKFIKFSFSIFFSFLQTYIGNILVSVNPFKSLNETYSIEMMTKFKCDELQQAQPHVYAFGTSLNILIGIQDK